MSEEKKPLTLEDLKKNKELLNVLSPNTQEIGIKTIIPTLTKL
jgi:hypothetical protein